MSQSTTGAHNYDPIALLAELVQFVQSAVHGQPGYIVSLVDFRLSVEEKGGTYRITKPRQPPASVPQG